MLIILVRIVVAIKLELSDSSVRFTQVIELLPKTDTQYIWGGWSSYRPYIVRNHLKPEETPPQQLISIIRDSKKSIFYSHVVKIDVWNRIDHQITINCSKITYPLLVEVDYQKYESRWLYFYLLPNQERREIKFGLWYNNNDYSRLINDNQCIQQMQTRHQIQVGGQHNFNGAVYAPFSGYLGVFLKEEVLKYQDFFQAQTLNLLDIACFRRDYELGIFQNNIHYAQKYATGYSFSFWFKSIKAHDKVEILEIQVPGLQQLSSKHNGLLQVEMSYLYFNNYQWLEIFFRNSYFPYIFKTIDEDIIEGDGLRFEPDISQSWSYIQYQYNLEEATISYKLSSRIGGLYFQTSIEQVNQLSTTQYWIFFNYFIKNTGQMADFRFASCSEMAEPRCLETCKECDSPLTCTRCEEEGHFFLNEDTKLCECQNGYSLSQQNKCEPMNVSLKCFTVEESFQQLEPSIVCNYGYFLYESECIKCPSAFQSLISCMECIENWETWVNYPYCSQSYLASGIHQNSFIYQDKVYFYLQDQELHLCEYCLEICILDRANCFLSVYQHKGQNTYIRCRSGTSNEFQQLGFNVKLGVCVVELNSKNIVTPEFPDCNESFCNKFCQCCQKSGCAYCIDPQKYYVAMNGYDCLECNIPNCKYCISHQKDNILQNNVYEFQAQPLTDQILTQCALCHVGYSPDFTNGQCIKEFWLSGCIFNLVDAQGNQLCYSVVSVDIDTKTNSPDYFFQVEHCTFLPNCLNCYQVYKPLATFYCIRCQPGYFIGQNFACQACQNYDIYSIECEYFSPEKRDTWKLELYGVLGVLLRIRRFFLLINPSLQQMHSLTCQMGHELRTRDKACENYSQTCQPKVEVREKHDCEIRARVLENALTECQLGCESCGQYSIDEINKVKPNYKNRVFIPVKCWKSEKFAIDTLTKQLFYVKNTGTACLAVKVFDFSIFELYNAQQVELEEYIRRLGADIVVFNVQLKKEDLSKFGSHLRVSTSIHQQVFMIKEQHLLLDCLGDEVALKGLDVINFTFVSIRKCVIVVECPLIQFFNTDGLSIEISDSKFVSLNTSFSFNFSILHSLQLKSVIFEGVKAQGIQFFKFHSQSDMIQQISLVNVVFEECNFVRTQILQSATPTQAKKLEFRSLTILNSEFDQVIILDSNNLSSDSKIIISRFQMLNCSIKNSKFFAISSTSLYFLQSEIHESNFTNSSYMEIVSIKDNNIDIFFHDLTLSHIKLEHSQFFLSAITKKIQGKIEIIKFTVSDVFLRDTQLFVILTNASFEIRDVRVNNLLCDEKLQFVNDLFSLAGSSIIVSNIRLLRADQSIDLKLSDFSIVAIDDIVYNGLDQTISQLELSHQCQPKPRQKLALLVLQDCKDITMTNIIVENLILANTILIKIVSLIYDEINHRIHISGITLENLLIFNLDIPQQPTLFLIDSDNVESFSAKLIIISSTFFQQPGGLTQPKSNTLIKINLRNSFTSISSFSMQHSYIAGQHLGYVSISSKTCYLQNLQLSNINILSDRIQVFLAEELEFAQMQEFFPLQSAQPIIQLSSEKLLIEEASFYNVATFQGSVIHIDQISHTQVTLNSISFIRVQCYSKSCESALIKVKSNDGVISLIITNIFAEGISSYHGSMVFIESDYSLLSQTRDNQIWALPRMTNKIKIYNFYARDYFSSYYSMIVIKHRESELNSQVNIKNLTLINQSRETIIKAINQLFLFGEQQGSNIEGIEAILQIQAKSIVIQTVRIQGHIDSKLLKFDYFSRVILQSFEVVKVGFPDSLMHLESKLKSEIKISSFKIKFASSVTRLESSLTQKLLAKSLKVCHEPFLHTKQVLEITFLQQSPLQARQNFGFESFMNLTGSKIWLYHFDLANLNCDKCLGALKLTGENIKVKNLLLQHNLCGMDSCIQINGKQQILYERNYRFLIKNALVIKNSAELGAGMKIQSGRAEFENTYFLQNNASYGGAIWAFNSDSLHFSETYIIENQAENGGGLFLGENVINNKQRSSVAFIRNLARYGVDNIKEQPIQLKLFNGKKLAKTYINRPNDQIIETSDQPIYLPSGQSLSEYRMPQEGSPYYPEFIAYTAQNEKAFDLVGTKCLLFLKALAVKKNYYFSILDLNASTESLEIPFDNESLSYRMNSLKIQIDPYIDPQYQIIADVTCDSIFLKNYKYQFQLKVFPCFPGEQYINSTCRPCLTTNNEYSVAFKAEECSKVDITAVMEFTSSKLNLKPGYWRPKATSNNFEFCYQSITYCLGGWKSGQESCVGGHIGALCEECDIYNIRGDGRYQRDMNRSCYVCGEESYQIAYAVLSVAWIIISTIMTAESQSDEQKNLRKLKLFSRHYKILKKFNKDFSATLIKMTTGYLQIIVSLSQFKLQLSYTSLEIFSALGNSAQQFSYSLECSLAVAFSEINIMYIRIYWMIILQLFYILCCNFLIYFLSIFMKSSFRFESGMMLTSTLYIYLISQPSIIYQLGALLSSRQISGLTWVQGNVAYLYTQEHIKLLLYIQLPLLIIFSALIPAIITLTITLLKKKNSKQFQLWSIYNNEFKDAAYYWETVRIVQRELIIVTLTIYYDEVVIIGLLIDIIIWLYVRFLQKICPYELASMNRFESANLSMCAKIITLGILIYAFHASKTVYLVPFLEVVLFSLILLLLINCGVTTLQCYIKKYEQQFEGLQNMLIRRFPNLKTKCPKLFASAIHKRMKFKEKLLKCRSKIISSRSRLQGLRYFRIQNSYAQDYNFYSPPTDLQEQQ